MPLHHIDKILIANRGEIAVRIQQTCARMGIATVAVYSDADREALHVREADEAIHIGPAASSESYLCIEKIIEAALASGAQAIHPGYGFLAENAKFARACAEASIVFIGPSPASIALLASKKEAKACVANAGVPVIPSFDLACPSSIKYPVLLKASAGGGGKGMEVVHSAAELEAALESATRVAKAAFGDGTILLEPYFGAARHIEVQILGDRHGNLVHIFERECSIQRRHQKIIEESPAPGISQALRERLTSAALVVGRAANYHNAGTVEFLVTKSGEFFFLEVNTRLQVEHPVTEFVAGLDLVRQQIRVAQGHHLGFGQEDLRQLGAAIECRLYAEDPDEGYLPCSGRIVDYFIPDDPGLRVDTGIGLGSDVSIHYDPMLAKVVTHAATREEARLKMRRALERISVAGLTTNRDFLRRVLDHKDFVAGKIDTGFLEQQADSLVAIASPQAERNALIAATVAEYQALQQGRTVLPSLASGYRNNRWRCHRVGFSFREKEFWVGYEVCRPSELRVRFPSPGLGLEGGKKGSESEISVRILEQREGVCVLEIDGHRRSYRITIDGTRLTVLAGGQQFDFQQIPVFPDQSQTLNEGGCIAPMPGTVIRVSVRNGDSVRTGDTIVVLEAMKMEHPVKAACDGVVSGLAVAQGDQVTGQQLLAVVQAQ